MNEQSLVNNYKNCRTDNFYDKEGFFPIFSSFKEKMRYLSPGATSLYIYLGLHANYKTGEVYHSLGTIAMYFGKSTRTITNWMKELEDNDLIFRKQKKLNHVSHTYLKPY